MSLLEQPTGQLKKYKPEELDEGLQKALKAIDEDIRKQESELERLKDNRKILKSDKKYMRENINSRINELKKEKQNLLFESKERSDWEFKATSFDPDNPATSDEMRRRSGAREKRLIRQQQAKERAKAKIAAGEVTAETPEGIKSPEVKSRIVPRGTPGSVLAMRGGPLGNPFGYWGGAGELYTVTGKNETEKIAKVVELHKNWLETGEVPDDVTPENKTKLAALREEQLKTIDNLPDDYKLGYYRPNAPVSHAITLENFIEERRKGGTPELKTVGWIDELADNEIFVFGSNQKGIHGKGAALDAKNKFGAVQGVGEGLTGQSYALPTKSTPYKSLTIDEVSKNLDTFLQFAADNPNKTFKMSAIGTNLAGFESQEIADLLFSKNIPSNVHVPENLFKLKGGTPDVKTSGTQYNVIEPNPRYGGQHGHYIWRTQYNYANSDITFDFTTGGPSGGGNSMGKGTADAMVKWENVLVDNTGKLTATNIDEVAQKLADALTSGQTVNIAGHGNYKSTRQGFPVAVWQSQVDTSMQTIFDRAKELAGDKPFTGKVISGGQSGFDEAGIRVARNLGIPTEVNIQEYTWRDADGDHFNDEQGFKDRIDADSYDSETYQGKSSYTKVRGPDLKDLPGTLSFIDDTPPELKADLGLMYKMPPALVDGVAKVGAQAWNQILKVLPIIDEEILIQAPSKILQYGLRGLGSVGAASAVGATTSAIGTYELFWMLMNLGGAVLNQAMGEAAEPGGVPPMLFSEHIELGENSEFSNAEQFMKDYEAWARGSVAMQTFRGVFGHDDPIEWAMSGFKKGERGVNFYGYNMVKGLFGGNK